MFSRMGWSQSDWAETSSSRQSCSMNAIKRVNRSEYPEMDGCSKSRLNSACVSEVDEHEDLDLDRRRVHNAGQEGFSRSQTWTTEQTHDPQPRAYVGSSPDYFSERRRFSLQLPSFQSLGIATLPTFLIQDTHPLVLHPVAETIAHRNSTYSSSLATVLCSIASPLTPPPEEISTLRPNHRSHTTQSGSTTHSASQFERSEQNTTHIGGATGGRVQGITIPQPSNMAESSQLQKSSLISEVSRKLLISLNESSARDQIHVISQTLPCQARDGHSRPIFEEILETLQTEMDTSPYITITHAVPLARTMDELPKTPPSTPNFRHERHDYFGSDQTIFTHAAAVPIYHCHGRLDPTFANRLVHYIAAPCSIQVSILERYIPPTMPQEVDDFFSMSTRSYLADRLSELNSNNGSLLLVYPTRKGGDTFARRYVAPVIDPFLRRFIMLKGLTSNAASLMGSMTAVANMIDFEEMNARITSMCHTLSSRSSGRGPQSVFSISHSETTTLTLDRPTWMNWFVEQEQPRLRQNLVEYHQAGGRMPEAEGIREVTVGMLTRDFIEGIQKSQEPAGDASIEVAIFLITRSKAQQ